MPETNLPTFTSPLLISQTVFPPTFSVSPIAPPLPRDAIASAQLHTAQIAQPSTPAPVILLPETGGGLGGFAFAVVFVLLCVLFAWAGREVKR